MSWRAPSLPNINDLNVSAAPRSVRSTFRCSPGYFRAVTTTRPFLAVQTGDDATTEDGGDMNSIDFGSRIRKIPGPSMQRIAKVKESRLPATPIHRRCADLLAPVQKLIDMKTIVAYSGQAVSIRGVIKSIRKQKNFAFAHVTDGSCFEPIQVMLSPELAAPLNNGTSLVVTGKWCFSPAKGQTFELQAEEVSLLGTANTETYPIQKKYQTPEFLRTIPHLRIRTPFNSVLARFRSSFLSSLNTYLAIEDTERTFVQVQPPIITSSDCEGAGEVFTVLSNAEASSPEQVEKNDTTPSPASFFRTPRYLSVSSQLHLEAYAAELQNVWALSPTFRAEKSDTPRHLAEFYMLEVETSYTTSLREMTLLVERLIRFVTSQLMKKKPFEEVLLANRANTEDGAKKIEEIRRRWAALLGEPWKSASYSYCIKLLREAAAADPKRFERQPEFGSGLQLEHERWIAENIGQDRPIFVTHYPQALKPFYMASSLLAKDYCRHQAYRRPGESEFEVFEDSEPSEDTVACFDLLLPFGVSEVAGGSLREHRLENLIQNMRQHGMLKPKSGHPSSNQANEVPNLVKGQEDAYPYLEPGESLGSLKWYADLRRYGTMPHGGFGIGVDRLIAYLTGVHNLRDVVSFPRTFGRADC